MVKRTTRTWLITGADKGLGLSTATAALERGDKVIVTVLAADGSHPLSLSYPDQFRSFHLDARSQDRIGPVVAEAEKVFGEIDILVNNAGYGLLAVAEATSAQSYRQMFEVDFFSVVEMTRAILPGMRRRRSGHIINISSIAGFAAPLGYSLYAAAKFAVEGYSEGLAKEVKHLDIKVTIVEPGGFRSDFAGSSLVSAQSDLADYAPVDGMIAKYLVERHGTQPNDPKKFGPAICKIVDETDPPLRLLLGEDAMEYVMDEIEVVKSEILRWKAISASTTFDS